MSNAKNIHEASDTNFSSEILESQSKDLQLVDFWAEWCGPCRMLAPTIEALATQFEGKVKVYKMNVDENPETPSKFHIRGIPTVILFQNGKVVDQLVGNQPKDVFVQTIQKHLS